MYRGNNNKKVDLNETEEPQVFKKCMLCRVGAASIKCEDCGREKGVELLCYGCSRKAHSERSDHNYEYAKFQDMLMTDDYRSNDTEPIQRHSMLANSAESRGHDTRPANMMQDTIYSKDEKFINSKNKMAYFRDQEGGQKRASGRGFSKESSGRKDYETFGQGAQPSQKDKVQNSKNAIQLMEQFSNKENMGTGNFGGQKQYPHNGHSKYINPKPATPHDKDEEIKLVQMASNRETENSGIFIRKENTRDYNNVPKLMKSSPQDSQEYSDYQMKRVSTKKTVDESRQTGTSENRDVSPEQLVLRRKQNEELHKTPISIKHPSRELRLLAGSNNKSRKNGESHSSLLHSPLYVESITDLHRTEIESLKTKHRVEIERLQTELNYLEKETGEEIRALRSEHDQILADLAGAEDRNEELEKIVHNLRTQNELLKEENELLRANAADNMSKEHAGKEETRRAVREFEGEMQRVRAKHVEDVNM